jgi:hypothetical protein
VHWQVKVPVSRPPAAAGPGAGPAAGAGLTGGSCGWHLDHRDRHAPAASDRDLWHRWPLTGTVTVTFKFTVGLGPSRRLQRRRGRVLVTARRARVSESVTEVKS